MYLLRSELEGDIEIVWKYTIWSSRSHPQLHKILSPAVDRVHSWSSWVRDIIQLMEHFPSMLQVMDLVPSTTNTGSKWSMSVIPELRTLRECRQEDQNLKDIFSSIASPEAVWAVWDTVLKISRWQNQQFLVRTPVCLPRCGSKEYKRYISYKTGDFHFWVEKYDSI